jgi:hypothetical protein
VPPGLYESFLRTRVPLGMWSLMVYRGAALHDSPPSMFLTIAASLQPSGSGAGLSAFLLTLLSRRVTKARTQEPGAGL